MNSNIIRFAIVLMIVASLATAGVALIYGFSKPKIDEARERSQKEAIALAFNMESKAFGENYELQLISAPDAGEYKCWKVLKKGSAEVLGYAAIGIAQGYEAKIKLVAAVNPDADTLIGAMIYELKDTPGLGSKALDQVGGKTWIEEILGLEGETKEYEPLEKFVFLWRYHGKTEKNLIVVKSDKEDGILAISGATITSNAVTVAVQKAWSEINKAKEAADEAPSAS